MRTRTALARRVHFVPLAGAVFAALVLVVSAGAAVSRSNAIDVDFAHRVVQNATVEVSARVRPAGVRCTLRVRYRNGAAQPGLAPVRAFGGRAEWRWRVPRSATPGAARATLACGSAGSRSWTFMVLGSVIPARIEVEKQGFSLRSYRSTSTASYGIILANRSPSDALDVTVLANFVMPDNRLIGTATTQISGIAANTSHAVGGELSFTGYPPIARLEIVVQIGKSGPPSRIRPAIAHARLVPGPFDPGYVGSVEGEVQNDQPVLTMRRAELTTVVFDAAGNVIGGGRGFASASIPAGAREFFKITNGMRPIPFDRAASVLVSVTPTYESPRG